MVISHSYVSLPEGIECIAEKTFYILSKSPFWAESMLHSGIVLWSWGPWGGRQWNGALLEMSSF